MKGYLGREGGKENVEREENKPRKIILGVVIGKEMEKCSWNEEGTKNCVEDNYRKSVK